MEQSSRDDNKNETCFLDSNESPAEVFFRPTGNYVGMAMIPWKDIWTSLSVAKLRGRTQMVDVFYDTLLKEALFDDHGAWSPLIR